MLFRAGVNGPVFLVLIRYIVEKLVVKSSTIVLQAYMLFGHWSEGLPISDFLNLATQPHSTPS
jgi:hypothetical protein